MLVVLRYKSGEKRVYCLRDIELGMVVYSEGNEKAIENYCGLMNKLTADFNKRLSK